MENKQKLGGLLSSFKDAIEPEYRQGAIYKINCNFEFLAKWKFTVASIDLGTIIKKYL